MEKYLLLEWIADLHKPPEPTTSGIKQLEAAAEAFSESLLFPNPGHWTDVVGALHPEPPPGNLDGSTMFDALQVLFKKKAGLQDNPYLTTYDIETGQPKEKETPMSSLDISMSQAMDALKKKLVTGKKFWAIVECMGHVTYAGLLSEEAIAFSALLRVDVPEHGDTPAFTKLINPTALYCMTPCDEEVVRNWLAEYGCKPFDNLTLAKIGVKPTRALTFDKEGDDF